MSDWTQIALIPLMLLFAINGWINSKSGDVAKTVYCTGMAILVGMVIF